MSGRRLPLGELQSNTEYRKTLPVVRIYTDGRGSGLKSLLRQLLSPAFRVHITVLQNATLEEVGGRIRDDPLVINADIVIVACGVFNLTTEDEQGVLHLADSTAEKLSDWAEVMLLKANADVHKVLYDGQKLIFCDVVGLDLARSQGNVASPELRKQQKNLNSAVISLNKAILRLNQENGVFGPWLANTVHLRWRKTIYRHRYERLVDGVNPSQQLQEVWAEKIAKCVEKNA